MPEPFRHYEDVPVIDLPADPPVPELPALDVLGGEMGSTPAQDGPAFLSELLFYSAAISASKRVPSTGERYSLRVNPSSGNLHPTEFHFITRGLIGWADGLYHYRPSSHMAEQRGLGTFELAAAIGSPIVFILTSIVWREAWKYRSRAYRYCLHDIGHAWQALALAARSMGCRSFATGRFDDNRVTQICHFHDDEWPLLVVGLAGDSIPVVPSEPKTSHWFGGRPNQLSPETIAYPLIERVHAATKILVPTVAGNPSVAPAEIRFAAPAQSSRTFGETVRKRRSAVDFVGGSRSLSLARLSTILAGAAAPFFADFSGESFIRLYLYAHRIDGLEPGVYRLGKASGELELMRSGDQRVVAAGLSLGQNLAGNACASFSLIGDLDHATSIFGDRGYRYVHFEAGAIGHRLYLAAEALGLGATGIGAFFDDEVHRYLNFSSHDGQVVYHFAIGYPAPDLRLSA
jgi:SagB-type dehydrogenase family enzyme